MNAMISAGLYGLQTVAIPLHTYLECLLEPGWCSREVVYGEFLVLQSRNVTLHMERTLTGV